MKRMDLDTACGRYLTFRDMIEVGETWQRTRIANLPQQPATMASIRRLADEIIDPLIEEFGKPEITYGFASPALVRQMPGRIDPARDQHAGHELGRSGRPICARLGQAVDLKFHRTDSGRVAAWVVEHLPFDRLYFYGDDRPFHVSIGPEESRAVITMFTGPSGRRIPRVRRRAWLREHCAAGLAEQGGSESC